MPTGDRREPPVPGLGVDPFEGRVEHRAETVGVAREDGVVEPLEHLDGTRPVGGGGADRVPRERGDRGCLGAGAAHIADDNGPAIGSDREHVVEVAADLARRAGRPVPNGDAGSVDLGQAGRQQRRLEDVGDVALLVAQPRGIEGLRDPTGGRLGERDIVGVVDTSGLGAHELHGADDPTLGHEGNGDQARRHQLVEDGPRLVGRRPNRVVDHPFAELAGEQRDELGDALANRGGRAEGGVGVVRMVGEQVTQPLDPLGIVVGEDDVGVRRDGRPLEEVERAPVAQGRDGCLGHRLHERLMVVGSHRRVVEARQELESPPLQSPRLEESLGLERPTLVLEFDELAVGHITRAPDRARHRAVAVLGDHGATLQPPDRTVGMQHPVFELVRRPRRHGGRNGRPGRVPVVGVDHRVPAVDGAVVGSGLQSVEPLHVLVPHDLVGVEIAAPRAQLAAGERHQQMVGELGGAVLDRPLIGHVVGDADRADDLAALVAQRSERGVDPHRRRVGAHDRQVTRPDLTGLDPQRDLVGGVEFGRQDQQLADVTTEHVARRPAVQPLGVRVPREHGPVDIPRNDRPRQALDQQLGAPKRGQRRVGAGPGRRLGGRSVRLHGDQRRSDRPPPPRSPIGSGRIAP